MKKKRYLSLLLLSVLLSQPIWGSVAGLAQETTSSSTLTSTTQSSSETTSSSSSTNVGSSSSTLVSSSTTSTSSSVLEESSDTASTSSSVPATSSSTVSNTGSFSTSTTPSSTQTEPSSETVSSPERALVEEAAVATKAIYRLYNPTNGEHLYTTDANEKDVLYKQHGWGYEGIGWYAPTSGTPVYRLYHAGLQNHLYTTDKNEVRILTSRHGWTSDNGGKPLFYSGGAVNIYRVYNANLRGLHHWTTDANEYRTLPQYGWSQEGVKFKGVQNGAPIKTQYYAFEVLSKTSLVFTSGVGGWHTSITVKPDGSFTGYYIDHDYSESHFSDFSGQFVDPRKLSAYEYHFTLSSLNYPPENQVSYRYINGVRRKYTTSYPYGIRGSRTFYLYLPGRPVGDLPKDLTWWIYDFNRIMPTKVTRPLLINGAKLYVFHNQSSK